MPGVGVKLYSVIFKLLLKHRLQIQTQVAENDSHAVSSRSGANAVPANAAFVDGVATKDFRIDPFASRSLRIYLPESSLSSEQVPNRLQTGHVGSTGKESEDFVKRAAEGSDRKEDLGTDRSSRRSSYGGVVKTGGFEESNRRSTYGGMGVRERSLLQERLGNVGVTAENTTGLQGAGPLEKDGLLSNGDRLGDAHRNGNAKEINAGGSTLVHSHMDGDVIQVEAVGRKADAGKERRVEGGNYRGYLPSDSQSLHRKLPIIFQFHGGGFVAGDKGSAANDFFCRRLAKLCDAIVIAVGYRLAPENKYPAAFDDGFEALQWLSKQANLAECSKSFVHASKGYFSDGFDLYRGGSHRDILDTFGASVVEPWLAAHGDPSRCVLVGVSCGANIADYVARSAVQAGKLLEPVKVVAQVLMYPFFIGSIPTHSEIKLANSYFYDRATCILAWKLFLPEEEFNLDHIAANPLIPGREPPLKSMPPTLTVVAELDWMKDRAIAYSEALRKVNIDAPVLEYKDAVHEFATLDILLKSRQAEACAEDIAIWVKKYISLKGHELSY